MKKLASFVVGSLMIVWLFATEVGLAISHNGWAIAGAVIIGMFVVNTIAELES